MYLMNVFPLLTMIESNIDWPAIDHCAQLWRWQVLELSTSRNTGKVNVSHDSQTQSYSRPTPIYQIGMSRGKKVALRLAP